MNKDSNFDVFKNHDHYEIRLNITGDYMCETDTESKAKAIVEALEKQILKKPKKILRAFEYRFGDCPNCNKSSDVNYKYCKNCGQKLEWNEVY